MSYPGTRFFRNGHELTFREAVRVIQDAAPVGTSAEEKESYNWLVKGAYDGDINSQLFLKWECEIICAAYDGTSIYGETGYEWPGHY